MAGTALDTEILRTYYLCEIRESRGSDITVGSQLATQAEPQKVAFLGGGWLSASLNSDLQLGSFGD